jgi:hypothetical protein
MVTLKSVEKQLKRISYNHGTWNRAEAMELPNILLKGETIYECVNGMYEGGFALLCATNVRLLLIDKKPFKFLTVEDLRFDMINQIDYSHRMFGARINVSAGSKILTFRSYNQQRLRKLISHIQHCMAESKKEQSSNAETQQQHLEQINQQLQAYLLAQHQQQETLRLQLAQAYSRDTTNSHVDNNVPQLAHPDPIKPSPELADYLFAQTLMKQYQASQQSSDAAPQASGVTAIIQSDAHNGYIPPIAQPAIVAGTQTTLATPAQLSHESHMTDLYDAGMKEVFGAQATEPAIVTPSHPSLTNPLEINPLRIAYSKLPMALRDRAFARRRMGADRSLTTKATTQVTQIAGA